MMVGEVFCCFFFLFELYNQKMEMNWARKKGKGPRSIAGYRGEHHTCQPARKPYAAHLYTKTLSLRSLVSFSVSRPLIVHIGL